MKVFIVCFICNTLNSFVVCKLNVLTLEKVAISALCVVGYINLFLLGSALLFFHGSFLSLLFLCVCVCATRYIK